MNIILTDRSTITLSQEEMNHPDFQKGMRVAREGGLRGSMWRLESFTPAAWIGYHAVLGMNTLKTEEEVHRALAVVPPA